MQVVILAGGLGTRLRPVTERVPKPMVEVNGHPFLEYIVRHLAAQDFSRMLMLVGYLGEQVRDYFGAGGRFGVSIQYAWEQSPLGTGGAIRQAFDQLEESFLLLYGDSYLPIEYGPVARAFRAHPECLGMLLVYDNRVLDTGVANNVALDEDGRLTRYEKGRGRDLDYVDAGVLCLRRRVFADLPAHTVFSMEQDLFPELIARRQLRGFVTTQRFFDIGTPARLSEFAAAFA